MYLCCWPACEKPGWTFDHADCCRPASYLLPSSTTRDKSFTHTHHLGLPQQWAPTPSTPETHLSKSCGPASFHPHLSSFSMQPSSRSQDGSGLSGRLTLTYAGPFFLQRILTAIDSPTPDDRAKAYIYAFAAFLTTLLKAVSGPQVLLGFRQVKVGTRKAQGGMFMPECTFSYPCDEFTLTCVGLYQDTLNQALDLQVFGQQMLERHFPAIRRTHLTCERCPERFAV